MKPVILPATGFLKQASEGMKIFDVRSNAEYNRGHIPGSVSVPLLNDEHRVIIGTLYKQEGREAAVLKGFELVGPLFHSLISQITSQAEGKSIGLYCWRGGLRSNIMAWLLQTAGYRVYLLDGGYKSFRASNRNEFSKPRKTIVIGGKTGSGKTTILNKLGADGEQIIDLEDLANHKGSTYGGLGMKDQPTQEHFENMLAMALRQTDPEKLMWIENESRNIGVINLPDGIYQLIKDSPQIELCIPDKKRRENIIREYGSFSKEELINRTERLERRLGGQHLKRAVEAIRNDEYHVWLDVVLYYYDRTYQYGNAQRTPESIISIETDSADDATLIHQLKETAARHIQTFSTYT